VNNISISIRIT